MEALSRAGFICPDGRVSVLGFSAYGLNKYDSFLFRLPSSDGNFISFFNFITSITPTSSLNLLKSARHIPLSQFEHFVERCPHLGFFPSLPLFPLLGLLIQHFPFRISRMESARMSQVLKLNLLVFLLILLKAEGFFVPITYIEDAVAKGAVCLDGSPPAYHFDKGSGSGINKWLIHIEGGGWCNNVTTCLSRKSTRLGSSKKMAKQVAFSGMLSNKEKFNPDFYNWNRIKVRYCDGASFTGDVEAVDSDTNLHFRGARVFVAIIEDLLAKGMKNAENAVLSGCSAGGLTSILHCDRFRALIAASAKVKCFSDAGYFINAKDVSGAQHIEQFYSQVVETHGSVKNLPRSCTSRLSPGLCFFPQYAVSQITTPIFFINAAYDSWQIKNILAPGVADPHGRWHSCKLDINNCSPDQLTVMQGFRLDFLKAVTVLGNMPSKGMFIDSCYAHCQTEMQETWLRSDSPVLHNKTIAKAVGDWYYDRSPFHQIDCPYPCNPTCHNRVFEPDHPSSV